MTGSMRGGAETRGASSMAIATRAGAPRYRPGAGPAGRPGLDVLPGHVVNTTERRPRPRPAMADLIQLFRANSAIGELTISPGGQLERRLDERLELGRAGGVRRAPELGAGEDRLHDIRDLSLLRPQIAQAPAATAEALDALGEPAGLDSQRPGERRDRGRLALAHDAQRAREHRRVRLRVRRPHHADDGLADHVVEAVERGADGVGAEEGAERQRLQVA